MGGKCLRSQRPKAKNEPILQRAAFVFGSPAIGRGNSETNLTISVPSSSSTLMNFVVEQLVTTCGRPTTASQWIRAALQTLIRTCRTMRRTRYLFTVSPRIGFGVSHGARMPPSRLPRPSTCAKTLRQRNQRLKWPSASSPSGKATTTRFWLCRQVPEPQFLLESRPLAVQRAPDPNYELLPRRYQESRD